MKCEVLDNSVLTFLQKEMSQVLNIKTDEVSNITGWLETAVHDVHMYVIE